MTFPRRPHETWDIECLPDYLLVSFVGVGFPYRVTAFELYPGHPLDRQGLVDHIGKITAVSFNGINYDAVIMAGALGGYDNTQLCHLSNCIIQRQMKPWEAIREFGLPDIPGFDHIDLREIPPKQDSDWRGPSLKIYAGKMHSKRMQDMPVHHTTRITPELRSVVYSYNVHGDHAATRDLRAQFLVQIEHREDLSEKYGIDVRSKSDAQISEAIIKKQLAFKPEVPLIAVGTTFFYEPPPFIFFQTPRLQQLLQQIRGVPFVIGASGVVGLPEQLEKLVVPVGSNAYTVRMGGLHSTETCCWHIATPDVTLEDIDVTSYYPRTIDVLNLFPPQIGQAYLVILRKLIAMRIEAKKRGDKKLADLLKIVINGIYGKHGSPYSILYAPQLMLQVTLTGQLALLMLIEAMELNGVQCVSANTDGIVLKYTRAQAQRRAEVSAWWERTTGYSLESTPYAAIFSRDVNSYIAFKPDGTAKKKGEFADPVPVASSWPNPECQVCVDALVSYLRDGTPIEQTVRECTDVRQFIAVRKVAGGGTYGGLPLGRAVRWYYSKQGQPIRNHKGHLVSQSEGSRPMMELLDTLPDDLDYDYYIVRAKRMLLTLGVQFV